MAKYKTRSVLTGMTVQSAKRKDVCRLPLNVTIHGCVYHMTRTRSNSVLLEDNNGMPCGLVSKTDVMAAFYAGFPIDTPAENIMNIPLFCRSEDPVDQILSVMKQNKIHRIYVQSESGMVQGTLSYFDIVGLMYRYCRTCIKSGRRPENLNNNDLPRLVVKDVMTDYILSCFEHDSIQKGIEVLMGIQSGAILVTDKENYPVGVLSKTDLNRAYAHCVTLDDTVKSIMGRPVVTCFPEESLVDVIQKMFLLNLQRLFVADKETGIANGVLSLSDAARFRSGTCKACSASRELSDE